MKKRLLNIKYKRKDVVEFGGVITAMGQPLKFTFGVRQVELDEINFKKFKSFLEHKVDEDGDIKVKAPYAVLIENGDLSYEEFEPEEKSVALNKAKEEVNKINQEDITKKAITDKINAEIDSIRKESTISAEDVRKQYSEYVKDAHFNLGKDKLLDMVAEKKVKEQLEAFNL